MWRKLKNGVRGRMRLGPFFLMGTLVLPAWLRAAPAGQAVDPARSAKIAAAVLDLQARYPGAQVYWEGTRVRSVFGRAVATGENAVATAAQFIEAEAGVFGVRPRDLCPGLHLSDARHTQPIMYDRKTGRYKFTLLYYSQYREGLPVFRSDLRILVRNEPGFPVVLVNSSLHDLSDFEVPEVSPVMGLELAEAAVAAAPGLTDFSPPRTVIWAGVDDMVVEPAVALEFLGTSAAPQRWLFIADAITGDILYHENRIITVDVTGNVGGLATEGTAPEHCAAEVMTAMPYAYVSIDEGDSAFADVNGNFVVPHDGIDEVTVRSPIRGEWFRVFNAGGDDTELSLTVTPPGPADFIHNEINAEAEGAEVNGYVHANVIRDFVLAYNPDYPTLDQTEFSVRVNHTNGYCPGGAWYDDGEPGINFCLADEGKPNTAYSSVIYHEYGHHLVAAAGSGQGQYGEGMSDTMSVLITGESGIAFGFYGDCSTPLRNADNDMQYPCEGESHECGQLLSGCVWSTCNELELTHPSDFMEIVASLAVNAILLHSGWSITPQITIDYLTLDDDDDFIGNGTPHRNEICAGFGAHNMDCPDLVPLRFNYPDGRPDVADPRQLTVFPVEVMESASAPVPGTGNLHYSRDGNPFEILAMNETSPNHYEAALPAADCGSRFRWFISAQYTGGSTARDPADAPNSTYLTMVASDVAVIMHDDFETDHGWSVENSEFLTDGAWERAIPLGCNMGDPPTDYDGSGQCYVTHNPSPVNCARDVDGGYTWLISPTLDLTFGDARINYALWYTDYTGPSPYSDLFKVHVSNTDGADWTLVETTGPVTTAGWTEHSFIVGEYVTPTNKVKVRFEASDLGPDSVVEAGVDAVTVSMFRCTEPPAPQPGGPACEVPTDCTGAYDGADCVAGKCYVPKNRYLSIGPAVNWPPVAYQVELTEAADYPTAVGRTWWMDEPQCYDYPNGDVVVPTPTSCEGSDRFGWVSKLTSTPVTRVWTESPVHISDCGIVPAVIYEIRASTDDGASFSAESLEVGTAHNPDGDTQSWGDLTGGPVPGMPGLWLPPDRAMSFGDIGNAIRTFENRAEDTGFPPRVWVDVEIDQVVSLADISFLIMAFEGRAYADLQLELIGVDPANCP